MALQSCLSNRGNSQSLAGEPAAASMPGSWETMFYSAEQHSTVSSPHQFLPTLVLGPHVACKPLQEPEASGQMRTALGNCSPFHFLQQTFIEWNHYIISALNIGKLNNISPERPSKNVI